MLFGYPVEATADNWIHEALHQALQTIHASLSAGVEPPPWPEMFQAEHRAKLSRRSGLRDRLTAYTKTVSELSPAGRAAVLAAARDQNDISGLLSCSHDCATLADLPEPIQEPLRNLFEFAYSLLADFGTRDRHYALVYAGIRQHVCPFCGCEYFDAPGGPREALDHYLAQSKYPLAAANLRNLVPMGHKCNSQYKLATDILRRPCGARRRSFDPYNHRGVAVSLRASQLLGGSPDGSVPRWQVEFLPDSEEVATWDEVFDIRTRYTRDVLTPSYKSWLWSLREWYRMQGAPGEPTDALVLTAIADYTRVLEFTRLTGRDFLRVPFFQMLHDHCAVGDPRLLAFMKDLLQD